MDAMLSTIEQPAEASSFGRSILPVIGVAGTMSWAIAGTQAAGEAGMHVIGCALVGCTSSLGGGTVNNLLFGGSRQGVAWVRNPHTTLMVALGASLVTFYTWPHICHAMAERHLENIRTTAAENSWMQWTFKKIGWTGSSTSITKDQFLAACHQEDFLNEMRWLLRPQLRNEEPSPEQLFDLVDADGNGIIDIADIQCLVKQQYDGSTLRYTLDTVAIATSAVTGTAAAISRGLHPIVCVCASVTLSFGSLIRDSLCNRELRLCYHSHAACTAAGACVYVSLRELCIRGMALPLTVRVLLSGGTTVALRIADFCSEGPLLNSMYGAEPE
jgi:uncharacterized membrane protein YeiH